MIVTFSKEKMLKRLEREGRTNEIDDESMRIMNKLDGQKADTYNWKSQVDGENFAIIHDDEYGNMYVNVDDCI